MASPLNGWNVVKMMLDEFDLSRRNESQITPQEVQLKDHLLRFLYSLMDGDGIDIHKPQQKHQQQEGTQFDIGAFITAQLNAKLQTARIESPISEEEESSGSSSTYFKSFQHNIPTAPPRRYVPLPPRRRKKDSPLEQIQQPPHQQQQIPQIINSNHETQTPVAIPDNNSAEYDPYDDGITENGANCINSEDIYEDVDSDENGNPPAPRTSREEEDEEEGIYETLSEEEGHYEAADSITGSTDTDGDDDVEYDEETLYEEIDSVNYDDHIYENASFLMERSNEQVSPPQQLQDKQTTPKPPVPRPNGATIYAEVITPKEISKVNIKKVTPRKRRSGGGPGLDEDANVKKEQRLIKKREARAEKLKERFNLTGNEIPVNSGTVKKDAKGSRHDLMVKKGETVLVLRMEGNPPGKWLAKSERGKVGYVDIANITVDPESVKTIMKQAQRLLCESR